MSRSDDMVAIRNGLVVLTMLAVAGCSGASFTGLGAPDTGNATSPQIARPAQPPVNMAGRWLLASPGGGQCNMTFGASAAGAAEGTIAPEGGCPGQFFTSRKWAFDSSGLSIRDHNGQPLAQMSSAGGARFDGKSTTGAPVTLSR